MHLEAFLDPFTWSLLLPFSPILFKPGCHLVLIFRGNNDRLENKFCSPFRFGVWMLGTRAVSMGVPVVATLLRANKRLLSSVQSLVCFQLTRLGESLGAVWVVTVVWPFTSVGAQVGLQGLLAGEIPGEES